MHTFLPLTLHFPLLTSTFSITATYKYATISMYHLGNKRAHCHDQQNHVYATGIGAWRHSTSQLGLQSFKGVLYVKGEPAGQSSVTAAHTPLPSPVLLTSH